MTILERLISPYALNDYLEKLFLKQAFYQAGEPFKFDFFFSKHDFRENLDRVDSIRAVFTGFKQAEIRPHEIPDMISAGATICVSGLEHAHPKVQRNLESIRREISFPGKIVLRAYMSPPGSGFDLHYDARAVTTLQISGEKEWWFSKDPLVDFPEENSPRDAYKEYPFTETLERVVLHPGDLLALPPGAIHRARAKSVCLALNLAFEYVGTRYCDLILREVRRFAGQQSVARQPLPRLPNSELRDVPSLVRAHVRVALEEFISKLEQLKNSESWISQALLDLLDSSDDNSTHD